MIKVIAGKITFLKDICFHSLVKSPMFRGRKHSKAIAKQILYGKNNDKTLIKIIENPNPEALCAIEAINDDIPIIKYRMIFILQKSFPNYIMC